MRLRVSPSAAAFVTGACVLAVELLVPRLVARHLGTSVVVWTSVLGVMLLGLAVGSAVGGKLADARGPRRAMAILLVAAAPLIAALPYVDGLAADALSGWPLLPRALLGTAIACLPAAILLGGVGPAVAKEAIERSPTSPGRALGRVAAAGALGSVLGTFATGFVLIPALSTSSALGVLAALVAVLGAIRALEPDPAAPRAAEKPPPRRAPLPAPTAPGLSPRLLGGLAFLAGAALLVLEVVAGRRAALFVGAGLFTWTSVIGAVLIGLAVGNTIGGRLADRSDPRAALGRLLLAASVLVMLTIWMPLVLAWTYAMPGFPYAGRVALGCLVAFGPAAAALGAIPPAISRAAVVAGDAATVGKTVGRLYALGTVGAVLAAVTTSPLALPALGTSATLASTALALALASALVTRRAEIPWMAGVAAVALVATLPLPFARTAGLALLVREDADDVLVRETSLQHLRIDRDPRVADGGPRVRRMLLDGMVHGSVDLDDPTYTGYGYEGVYAAVTDRVAPKSRPPRALFLGGGPYVFPRRLLAVRPDAIAEVAEIDAGVTKAAIDALALPATPPFRIAHEDARTFVRDRPAGSPPYDLVYGDAFNAFSVPFHLTTIEFARALKAEMAPDGVYLVNVIDVFDSGLFVGAMRETLSRVFAHVQLTSLDRDGAKQDNFVLVASDRAIDLEGLVRPAPDAKSGGTPIPVARYTEDELAALRRRSGGLVLTDDHAPVENLLAPVVSGRVGPRP